MTQADVLEHGKTESVKDVVVGAWPLNVEFMSDQPALVLSTNSDLFTFLREMSPDGTVARSNIPARADKEGRE